MHTSSFVRMRWFENNYRNFFTKDCNGKVNILDVGSYNVNGSYKNIFDSVLYNYTGLDLEMGPNVDFVPKNSYNWHELKNDLFDVVISGQAFEHIEFIWITIKEIARITKPGGIVCIIAPNSTQEHKYPLDCYRFFSDGMRALAKYAELDVLDVTVSGIPSKDAGTEWDSEHNDVMLIAQKNGGETRVSNPPKLIYERRTNEAERLKQECYAISDFLLNFRRAYVDVICKKIDEFDFKKYLLENNIKNVSIYGMDNIGFKLYDRLEKLVNINQIFDPDKECLVYKRRVNDLSEIKEESNNTDIVIITLPDKIGQSVITKISSFAQVKCALIQDILF